MPTARRLKVLLIAEGANPDQSSVALEGWSLSRALLRHVDGHVAVQIRNRGAIEKAGWQEGREFTAIDAENVAVPMDRFREAVQKVTGLGWTFTTALSIVPYFQFERLVWKRFGEAIQRREFDIVHRVIPLSPTTPSLIATRCQAAGVPFVWGPINGGVPWPKEFRDRLRSEGEWLSYIRDAHRLMPYYAATRRSASALIAGSTNVWEQLTPYRDKCVYIPENAIDPERFAVEPAIPPQGGGPLRVSFVGRLVPYKGADMLIEAAAPLIRAGKVVVDIIGDGPQMPELKRQVAEAQLGSGVELDGWIDHRLLAARLVRSQVFGFPSVREFGGAVVLEAMALGIAPLIVDYAGPAEHVTEKTGFKVPIGSREAVVTGFRKFLEELAADPERARVVGQRARRRVFRHYTWDVKAREIVEVYDWVLGKRGRPDYGMPYPDDEPRPGDNASARREADQPPPA
jgi:glycosyltransferase involved in cell wall biosynthesis